MSNYAYIDHVLGSYFAADVVSSGDEAIAQLRQHLEASPLLASGLTEETKRAFCDSSYSWRDVLAKHDVLCVDDEAEAKSYAEELFAEILGKGLGSGF